LLEQPSAPGLPSPSTGDVDVRIVDVDADLEPVKRSLPGDDRFTDELFCECGVALDVHPPLPPPGPLNRWRAEHAGWSGDVGIDGNPRPLPGPTWRSAQAAAYRNRNR
jgi:hypothetical protein